MKRMVAAETYMNGSEEQVRGKAQEHKHKVRKSRSKDTGTTECRALPGSYSHLRRQRRIRHRQVENVPNFKKDLSQ